MLAQDIRPHAFGGEARLRHMIYRQVPGKALCRQACLEEQWDELTDMADSPKAGLRDLYLRSRPLRSAAKSAKCEALRRT
jgi:hypothetical protein